MKFYWESFKTFFKIGAFTLGGGYAMIPIIESEVVEKRKWIGKWNCNMKKWASARRYLPTVRRCWTG